RRSPPDSYLPGGGLLTPICRGEAHLTPICRGGGAQNPGPDSMKRPAHTCAISILAIPKTWSRIGDFIPPKSLRNLQIPKWTLTKGGK
ncbi:unnamed protein product, partial [Staurois parvus]